MTSPHLQSNLPAPGTPSYSDPITDLNESNQSSVPLIQKSGASTLKQKLLLKKIADNLALPRDTQEDANPAPNESNTVSHHFRVKGATSLQSTFKRLSLTAQDQQRLQEAEMSKVRACIAKTRGFSSLGEEQLDLLLRSGQRNVYDSEEILIVQNDTDVGYFFVLIEGTFKYVVQTDSEALSLKSGVISSTDHGNLVGHFGSLYQRPRDSSVFSVPGAIAWRFSLDGIPGFVMRAEAQAQPAPAPSTQATAADSREWIAKISLLEHEIEELQGALEDRTAELQVAKDSEARYMSECAALDVTVASQELQLKAMFAQAASDRSVFLQEKDHLQLLFDKQQQLCASLTSQVVALTANCERLQSQAQSTSIKHQLQCERYAKELDEKDAVILIEQKRCSEAISRGDALENVNIDLQSKLDTLQSLNVEQTKQIASTLQQLDEALRQVAKYEHDASVNETLFLHRKARASQTVDQDDLDRCAFESSVNATRVVLLQLQADCNQVLMQCERDTESNKVQITKLQFYLSEKQKELERVIVDADLRFAERERSFEDQLRSCGSELRQKLVSLADALEQARDESRQFQHLLVQAESHVQSYKSQVEAMILAEKSLETQNAQLLFDNAALEGNLMKLRGLLSGKQGASCEATSVVSSPHSSSRDLALIAHLESRAKDSEQRAECMMFQKNEAQSRCQLAELSLDHFQRLCASSLSLLRANVSDADVSIVIDAGNSPPGRTHVAHAAKSSDALPRSHKYVQEAGELLASAASRWAAEDIQAACAADHSDAEVSQIALLDEIHRLRLQLSTQHVRVINSYAEGFKSFSAKGRPTAGVNV